MKEAFERFAAAAITEAARLLTGVRSRWVGCAPDLSQRIYFANHTSHADFLLLWSALPAPLRAGTRPVAAADYWGRGAVRRFLIGRVFRGVLIARQSVDRNTNPLTPMLDALDEGSSLILFPEGTRGDGEQLQPFKSGIYHLAASRPHIDLIPVWMDNSYRVMPKGAFLPVPLLCSVTFGEPARIMQNEPKEEFLERLRQALQALAPDS